MDHQGHPDLQNFLILPVFVNILPITLHVLLSMLSLQVRLIIVVPLSCSMKKLPRVQNFAAKVVLCLSKLEHITPALIQLHWLPVDLGIHI